MAPSQKTNGPGSGIYVTKQKEPARKTRVIRERETAPQPDGQETKKTARQRESAHTGGARGAWALLAVLVLLACAALLGWKYFTIRQVDITGNEALTWQDLYDLSGVRYNESMFMLDTRLVKERLQSNPLVKVLSVERLFPDTVVIEIFERKPRAAIEMGAQYVVIGEDNVVLEICSQPPAGAFPLIERMELSRYDAGRAIEAERKEKLDILNRLLEAAYQADAVEWINRIDLSDPQNVVLLHGGIYILVGELENLSEKFNLLDQIMPSIERDGHAAGKIYLTKDSVNFVPQETGDTADETP